jgi:hypothetical protein
LRAATTVITLSDCFGLPERHFGKQALCFAIIAVAWSEKHATLAEVAAEKPPPELRLHDQREAYSAASSVLISTGSQSLA